MDSGFDRGDGEAEVNVDELVQLDAGDVGKQ